MNISIDSTRADIHYYQTCACTTCSACICCACTACITCRLGGGG